MKLLLDTNVLLLWLVGTLDIKLVGLHRRLRAFDLEDFVLVNLFANQSAEHISTPHILAEVSNFLGSGPQQMVKGGTHALRDYVNFLEEHFLPARDVVALPEFLSLGLTDVAIFQLAEVKTRVVSMDFHLCNLLAAKGIETVNPRHFRTPGYAST